MTPTSLSPTFTEQYRTKRFQSDYSKRKITISKNSVQVGELINWQEISRSYPTIIDRAEPLPHVISLNLSSIIAVIKTAFGITIKDMAKIFRVERQTIYAWMGEENQPHESNRERLENIKELADYWLSKSKLTLQKPFYLKGNNSCSLFDLLCKDVIPMEDIKQRLDSISREDTISIIAPVEDVFSISESFRLESDAEAFYFLGDS